MNTLRNSVRLYGNVGKEPEVKTFESGNKVATFTLATTERRKDQQGNWSDETTWHNLVVWGKPVDVIEKYVNKGDKLSVEGRLTNRSYEAKDGTKKYFTEIVVNDFLLMGSPKGKVAVAGEVAEADDEGNLPF
ncbi:MAG: single-stranded DNA-binding protein [Bacteroidia bacterium]